MMRPLHLLSALLGIWTSCFAQAQAQEPLWKNVSGWDVRVDRTLNFGCFIFRSFERGSIFRMGFDRQSDSGYFIIANDQWKSIEIGKEYKLEVQMDGETPWQGNATAVNIGDGKLPFLWMNFKRTDFLTEVARKQWITFRYKGQVVTSLSLTGSYAAVQALVQCQEQIEQVRNAASPGTGRGSADPFARTGVNPKSDPFR
jgi:hypothetical protein